MSEAVTRAALARRESRGAHTRVEFPDLDKHFGAVNVVCRRQGDSMVVAEEPLPQMPDELRRVVTQGRALAATVAAVDRQPRALDGGAMTGAYTYTHPPGGMIITMSWDIHRRLSLTGTLTDTDPAWRPTVVGGPTTSSVLFDVGSIYYLGLGSVRIATSLTNFGSEMQPSGDYNSPYTGEVRSYDGFDPPMVFRYGLAFEPVENQQQRLTTSFDVSVPADNQQMIKAGAEWSWKNRLALRSGYNFNADALKLSAGAGLFAPIGQHRATIDYAYTDGGHLGAVHRLTLGYRF